MATLEEVYGAVLKLCPEATVADDAEGNILIVLNRQLGDDKSTLVSFTEYEEEED
jgi:hypothetical protein